MHHECASCDRRLTAVTDGYKCFQELHPIGAARGKAKGLFAKEKFLDDEYGSNFIPIPKHRREAAMNNRVICGRYINRKERKTNHKYEKAA